MPVEFIYEPWEAPTSVQREAGCIIGEDYPQPIVNHKEVSRRNQDMMEQLQINLMREIILILLIVKYLSPLLQIIGQ